MINITNKMIGSAIALSSAIILLSGCGGDSGTTYPPSFTIGHLTDSPVGGVNYTCSDGASGLTARETGAFTCVSLPVTFSIGSLTLGTVSSVRSDSKVMPQDLVGVYSDDYTNANVINLAILLQSLDENDDKTDIYISQAIASKFTTKQNIQSLSLAQVNSLISGLGKTPIDSNSAIAHLKTYTPSNHNPSPSSIGSSTTSSSGSSSNTNNITNAIVSCDSGWTTLVGGQSVTATTDNTVLTYNQSDSYKVCVNSGSAVYN